ncbi:MAG: hypothetical protein GY711_26880 [bacterium]|nr:hypothetical protein [bacterium]
MSLSLLVSKDHWQEFDDAWKERFVSEEPIDDLLVALQLAGEKKRIARCVALAKEHVSALEELGRKAEAAQVIGGVLIAGGNPAELTADLMRLAREAWADETWFEPYAELTGLQEGSADLRGPWRAFAKLYAMQVGSVVYHPGGWGAGEVLALDPGAMEVEVKFASGRGDRFPMSAAIEIFEPLAETDLKAQYFRDPEGLRKRAKKEPLEVLRRVVQTGKGKATTAAIRLAMMGIGIEGSAWSAWWRKARKLAETSEWFEVSGSPQKSVVTLLLTAKDPTEALRKQLTQASSVAEVHSKVRDLFIGKSVDEKLAEVGVEVLESAAAVESDRLEERVAAWLFLRERRGESPDGLLTVLREVLGAEPPPDPSTPSELWKLFQALPNVKDQERSVEVLPELFGEGWLEEVLPHMQHAAPGQVRPLVDKYKAAKRHEDLRTLYHGLLARPLRSPLLLVTLAALFEGKKFPEDFHTPVIRAQALISLAQHLFRMRRGNPQLTRVCARLTDLLTKGETPLLKLLLADADLAALRTITMTIAQGADPEIDHVITDIALEKDRDFFTGDTAPFWVGETIWTTKLGLTKRSNELRELRETKIPENEEAIGRAASFGDLSENSEWEAAIEEQRNLTSRAMAIEEELRSADLIENATLPEATACPGSRVRYREDSGSEIEIVILGPWDGDEWNGTQIVSYRAPLAAGLLGKQAGDEVVLKLPSGELAVQVLEISAEPIS